MGNRLSGPLVVRRARPGERLTTLDGVARALDPEDMVICDQTGPISLAAVMGGESSEMLPGSAPSGRSRGPAGRRTGRSPRDPRR